MQVVDSGIGVDPRDAPTLFEKFGKLLRTAERNDEGIGLGLMVSKAITERGGGQIKFYSPGRDRGSSFFISMPMTTVEDSRDEMNASIQLLGLPH